MFVNINHNIFAATCHLIFLPGLFFFTSSSYLPHVPMFFSRLFYFSSTYIYILSKLLVLLTYWKLRWTWHLAVSYVLSGDLEGSFSEMFILFQVKASISLSGFFSHQWSLALNFLQWWWKPSQTQDCSGNQWLSPLDTKIPAEIRTEQVREICNVHLAGHLLSMNDLQIWKCLFTLVQNMAVTVSMQHLVWRFSHRMESIWWTGAISVSKYRRSAL